MTKGPIKNVAASVRQRLLNVAHTTHRRFSDVLFEIALLAATFEFDGAALAVATPATFDCRTIELPADPVCLSDRFAKKPTKGAQWKAFVRRSLLADAPAEFADVAGQVRNLLQLVAVHLAINSRFDQHWSPCGPWQ